MLEIDVALTPRLFSRMHSKPVVVLVDVLRATSTITTLFELGALGVEVARGLEQAKTRAQNGRVVCAEQWSGRQARGADLPISPSRLTEAAVGGREVVVCTTNGTRALRRVASRASHVVLGCLLNASAVAAEALALAERLNTSVSVVCAGRKLGAIPCMDDTYAAGTIVERATALANQRGQRLVCSDAATLARLVARTAGPAVEVLAESATGEILRRADSDADIAFCARTDATELVPVLVRGGGEARYPVVLL